MYDGFTTQGTPTGKVQFLDGGQPLGAPVALAGGTATIKPDAERAARTRSAPRYVPEGAYDASRPAAELSDVVPVTGHGRRLACPRRSRLTLGAPAQFGAFIGGRGQDLHRVDHRRPSPRAPGDAALSWTAPDPRQR